MVMAVGLSQHNVALMHVVNHAFFIREPYESNLV
jgi:NADH:ubiquinone oxidoreductase subunit 5 (subunit L)/multisubunit Na+/H+ antiporter MnhA subunit